MQELLSVITWLVIVVWVGGLVAFGVLFAPIVFRTLPGRAEAGRVSGAVLARLESVGLVSGGILLMGTVVQAMEGQWNQIDLIRVLLVAAMLGFTLFGSVVMRPRIEAVRSQMSVPIDELAADDPLRLDHRRLHRTSVLMFQAVVLMGTGLVVLSALRL